MSKKLQDRIEELERKVRDLEARPFVVVQPMQPIVITPPAPPAPSPYTWPQFPIYPTVTCVTIKADPNAMLFNGQALTN